ncbi:hypothetical protein AAKU58_002768 [Oxalobacteraceae bacterium GrIS 1.18]
MDAGLFSFHLDPALTLTAACTVAGIMIASAIPKLRDLASFEEVVVEYRILPEGLARLVGRALPWLELLAAVGLVYPMTSLLSAQVLALLVAGFGCAIAVNLLRGRTRIDCGCGVTEGSTELNWLMLGRNAFLLILLAISAGTGTGRALILMDAWMVVTGSASLIGLYMTADYLLANLPRINQLRS